MPLAALLCAWSPTFADSLIPIAVKNESEIEKEPKDLSP